ncbi:1267_t:CDS:2 [Gigaspora rosea]|nr:1267_t:CDS:2 [Gigaspora rosea]
MALVGRKTVKVETAVELKDFVAKVKDLVVEDIEVGDIVEAKYLVKMKK